MPLYNWTASGLAANGQTWTVQGQERIHSEGAFIDLPTLVMKNAFIMLTQGRAVFGQPGKGCAGPYRIRKLLIECAVEDDA